jgi:hypothetical protein
MTEGNATLAVMNAAAYCALSKADKAAEEHLTLCPWPYVPGNCTETWPEYVGATSTISSIVYGVLFGVMFIVNVRYNVWAWQRQKMKKKNFFDRTAAEWLCLYYGAFHPEPEPRRPQALTLSFHTLRSHTVIAMFLRLVIELDFGNAKGIISFKLEFVIQKVLAGILMCTLYTCVRRKRSERKEEKTGSARRLEGLRAKRAQEGGAQESVWPGPRSRAQEGDDLKACVRSERKKESVWPGSRSFFASSHRTSLPRA